MKKTYIVPTLAIHRLTPESQLLTGSKIDIDYGGSGTQSEAESKIHSYASWEQDYDPWEQDYDPWEQD